MSYRKLSLVAAASVAVALAWPTGSMLAQHGGHGGGHWGGAHHGGGHWGGGHHGIGHIGGGHHGGGVGIHLGGGHHGGGIGIHLGGGHHGGHYYGGHVFGHHLAHDYFSYGHHAPLHFGFSAGPWYGWYDDPHYDYYVAPVVVQPVVQAAKVPVQEVPAARPDVPASSSSADGVAYKRRAEAAFRAGNYREALRHANHAIVELPRDGKLYLLTAQALLAVGDYRSAAAAIHQGVSLLDAEEWGYVVKDFDRFYQGDAFVRHIKQLDEYIEKNPQSAYAYFVRGYEYGFLDYKEAAIKDLRRAFELEPRDELAARLIERFGGAPPVPPKQGTVPPAPNSGDAPAPQAPAPSSADSSPSGSHDGHDHDHGDHDHGASATAPPLPPAPSAAP